MALVQFSSLATGPFIMFRETAERIFHEINEPFHEMGGIAADELPLVLEKLKELAKRDRESELKEAAELEKRLRNATYDEELRQKEDASLESEKTETRGAAKGKQPVRLYQRIAPLAVMIERAIARGVPITWGRP